MLRNLLFLLFMGCRIVHFKICRGKYVDRLSCFPVCLRIGNGFLPHIVKYFGHKYDGLECTLIIFSYWFNRISICYIINRLNGLILTRI